MGKPKHQNEKMGKIMYDFLIDLNEIKTYKEYLLTLHKGGFFIRLRLNPDGNPVLYLKHDKIYHYVYVRDLIPYFSDLQFNKRKVSKRPTFVKSMIKIKKFLNIKN